MVIELRNVGMAFGSRRIFAGLNLRVATPGCLVVTGPNGSGKSTLLRVISGLIQPTRGEVVVTLGGQILQGMDYRRNLGLVAPDLVLYDELTALENLGFFAKVRGLVPGKGEIEAMLQLVGLGGEGGYLIRTYSTGMKQRLKYACALLPRPRVLLLDEPGSNFDQAGLDFMAGVIGRQKSTGILIMATNQAKEVSYGDQVLQLGN
jgi:heme exporter protein A